MEIIYSLSTQLPDIFPMLVFSNGKYVITNDVLGSDYTLNFREGHKRLSSGNITPINTIFHLDMFDDGSNVLSGQLIPDGQFNSVKISTEGATEYQSIKNMKGEKNTISLSMKIREFPKGVFSLFWKLEHTRGIEKTEQVFWILDQWRTLVERVGHLRTFHNNFPEGNELVKNATRLVRESLSSLSTLHELGELKIGKKPNFVNLNALKMKIRRLIDPKYYKYLDNPSTCPRTALVDSFSVVSTVIETQTSNVSVTVNTQATESRNILYARPFFNELFGEIPKGILKNSLQSNETIKLDAKIYPNFPYWPFIEDMNCLRKFSATVLPLIQGVRTKVMEFEQADFDEVLLVSAE